MSPVANKSVSLTSAALASALKEVEKAFKKSKIHSTNEAGIFRFRWPVPHVRKRLKEGYSFSVRPSAQLLKIWDCIWRNSKNYETMSSALYYCQGIDLKKSEFQLVARWVERCSCWEHSDDLSKIYADVVESNPDWILSKLKSWNVSKNPWKRRQSVVSLLEYASKRSRYLSFSVMIGFVDNLLSDPEYYVQKGVGWTLREIYNVYPGQTLTYIKKNLGKIDAKAYSAATEKVPAIQKKKLNSARRSLRASNK